MTLRETSTRIRRRTSFWMLILFVSVAVDPVFAQRGIIVVDDSRHDFGTIQEGDVARHVFTISNTGDGPFTLTAVRPSCGCTTPEWTTDPLLPGEEGAIAVEYDSEGLPGAFEKLVSVESDANPDRVLLYIKGYVEPRSLAGGDTLGSLVFKGVGTPLPIISPGDPLAHTLTIKNISEHPIRIREIRTDAEHVSVEAPEDAILPGDMVDVSVAFDTSQMRAGPFSHRIDLITTDSKLPIKEIRLTGLVR